MNDFMKNVLNVNEEKVEQSIQQRHNYSVFNSSRENTNDINKLCEISKEYPCATNEEKFCNKYNGD